MVSNKVDRGAGVLGQVVAMLTVVVGGVGVIWARMLIEVHPGRAALLPREEDCGT